VDIYQAGGYVVSFFNAATLKSAADDLIPSQNREPIGFTTAVLNHDTLLQFGLLGKGFRLINDDSVNVLTYRLHSNRAVARTVPVSSEILVQEWYSILLITPNAVTGNGILEMELVDPLDARKPTRRLR